MILTVLTFVTGGQVLLSFAIAQSSSGLFELDIAIHIHSKQI